MATIVISNREKLRNCADSSSSQKALLPRRPKSARLTADAVTTKSRGLLPNDRLGPGSSSFRSAGQRPSAKGAHDRSGRSFLQPYPRELRRLAIHAVCRLSHHSGKSKRAGSAGRKILCPAGGRSGKD